MKGYNPFSSFAKKGTTYWIVPFESDVEILYS